MSEQKEKKKKTIISEEVMSAVGGGDARGDYAGRLATQVEQEAMKASKTPWNGKRWQRNFDKFWAALGKK